MHGLVWQMAKPVANSGNHPAGQIHISPVQSALLTFDRTHHLLRMKTRPAAKRLGEL